MNHFDPTRALGAALAASICVSIGCANGVPPDDHTTNVEEAGIATQIDSAAPDVWKEVGGFGLDGALADEDTGAVDSGARDTAFDSSPTDTAAEDTSVPDTGPEDTGTLDTAVDDTGAADTGTPDTAVDDTGAADTGTLDTGTLDTGTIDTGTLTLPDSTIEDTTIEDTTIEDARIEDTTIEDTGSLDTSIADSAPADSGTPDAGSDVADTADTFVYVAPTVRVVAPTALKLGYNKSSDACQGSVFRAEYTASAGVRSVQWKFFTPNAATATTAMLGTCTGAAAYGYFLDPAALTTRGTIEEDVAIAGLYSGPAGSGRWWWCTAPGTAPKTAVSSPPAPGTPGVQTLANYCAAKSAPPDSDLGSRWRLELTLTDKTGATVTDNFYFWVHQ